MKRELEALKKLEATSYTYYNQKPPQKPAMEIPQPRVLDRDHYSVAWVAKYLNCTERHVYRLIADGTLAECMDISRTKSKRSKWQIPRESIIAYKKSKSTP